MEANLLCLAPPELIVHADASERVVAGRVHRMPWHHHAVRQDQTPQTPPVCPSISSRGPVGAAATLMHARTA
eukprot:1503151-Rhodomonas_salina.2